MSPPGLLARASQKEKCQTGQPHGGVKGQEEEGSEGARRAFACAARAPPRTGLAISRATGISRGPARPPTTPVPHSGASATPRFRAKSRPLTWCVCGCGWFWGVIAQGGRRERSRASQREQLFPRPALNHAPRPRRARRLSFFPQDGTLLLQTSDAPAWTTSASEWRYFAGCVPAKLAELAAEGYEICVLR